MKRVRLKTLRRRRMFRVITSKLLKKNISLKKKVKSMLLLAKRLRTRI